MGLLLLVKLPAHRAALPGHAVASRMRAKEVSFILCPPWSGLIDLTPPIPLWRDGARSGQTLKRKLMMSPSSTI
jgi:hypothetical protein